MLFTKIVIVYGLILITVVCERIINNRSFVIQTKILNQVLVDSYHYAKNIVGYDMLGIKSEKEQEEFVNHSITFLWMNHKKLLTSMGFVDNKDDNDRLYSLLLSKIIQNGE